MKAKGLNEYLKDDPSLTKKLTYEEFQNSIVLCADLDDGIEEAYEKYRKLKVKSSYVGSY